MGIDATRIIYRLGTIGEILGETDDASDAGSSIDTASGSIGDSTDGTEEDGGERDENRNDWEHLSPKEMRYLSSGVLSPSSPSPIPLHGGLGVGGKQPSPLQSPRMSASSSPLGGGSSAIDLTPGSPIRPFTISGVAVGTGNSSRPGSRRNSRSNSESSPLRPVLTDWKNDDELDSLDMLAQAEARREAEGVEEAAKRRERWIIRCPCNIGKRGGLMRWNISLVREDRPLSLVSVTLIRS